MQSDQDFTLELTTIARLLCLNPHSKRAVKLSAAAPIYRIEDRKTDRVSSLVLFQPINKRLSEIRAAPTKRDLAKNCARISAECQKPYFILYHWQDRVFGLAKGADYFALDQWGKPANRPDILIAPKDQFVLAQEYEGKDSRKISIIDRLN